MSADFVAEIRLEGDASSAIAALSQEEAALGEVAKAAARASQTIAQEARQAEAAVKAEVATFQDLHKAAAMDFATPLTGQLGGVARGAKLTTGEMLNLSRQFADVGVTAAMGMSPLMILIQQGPQIADTFATAASRGMSFSMVLKEIAGAGWAAVAPLAPFIAAAAAVAAVVGGGLLMATHELNRENGDLAAGLGLTEKQLEKVKEKGVTTGDVLKGSFTYAGRALAEHFAPEIKAAQAALSAMYRFMLDGAKAAVNGTVGGFGAGIAILEALFGNFGAVSSDALISAANLGLSAIEGLVNGAINMLNALIARANIAAAAVGLPIRAPTLDQVSWTRLANQHAGAMASVGKAGVKGYGDAVAGLKDVWADMQATIVETATARIREAAGTDEATEALKGHTQAVKDYTAAAPAMIADLSRMVDLSKAMKSPGKVEGLKDVAGQASAAWGGYQAEGQKVIDQLAADFEREFVRSGELSFDSIGDYAEQQFRQAIYNSFLKEPINILINAVVGNKSGLLGSLGAALGGGMAGVGLGQSLGLGTGNGGLDMGLGLGGAAVGAGLAGSALSGTIGAGIANGIIGLGGSAALAGSLGTLLSSAAVLGPIAAIAALAIGTLFKKKPSNNGAQANLTDTDFSLVGDKRTAETTTMATNAANAVLQGEAMLKAAGITLNATVKSLDLGTRDATDIVLSDGRAFTSAVGDAAAAAETGLKAVLATATYKDDAQKALVEGLLAAGKGFDEIAAALGQLGAAQAIPQAIADAILKLTDPKGYDVAQLGKGQAARRGEVAAAAEAGYLTAAQLTAVNEQLTRLEALELDEVMSRFGDATEKAAENLSADINEGFLKILNPAAYQQARGVREIEDNIAAMKASADQLIASGQIGAEVLGRIDSLRDLQLADLMSEVAQTADTFAAARKSLRQWLDALNTSASAELSPVAQRAQALADYQRVRDRARGGDTEAAGQVTSYADRLFAADREATDSAQARLALFNQVRGEIEGLAAGGGAASNPLAAQLQVLGIPLDKLVMIGQMTAAANDDIAKAVAPSLAVSVANIPTLRAMYAEVETGQTDRVVAAIETLRSDLKAAIADLAKVQGAGSNAAQAALEAALSGVGAGIEYLGGLTAEQTATLIEMRRTGQIAGAAARFSQVA